METIAVGNKRTITAKAVDDAGNQRPTDAAPYTWTANRTGLVSLTPSSDGRQCDVTGLAPGTTKVTAHADADPGPAVTDIMGEIDLTITVLATKLELTAGPEVPVT